MPRCSFLDFDYCILVVKDNVLVCKKCTKYLRMIKILPTYKWLGEQGQVLCTAKIVSKLKGVCMYKTSMLVNMYYSCSFLMGHMCCGQSKHLLRTDTVRILQLVRSTSLTISQQYTQYPTHTKESALSANRHYGRQSKSRGSWKTQSLISDHFTQIKLKF